MIKRLKCLRCEKQWIPRIDNPEMCPRCKSYKWDEEKKDVNIFEE
jgi:hypothetical protein